MADRTISRRYFLKMFGAGVTGLVFNQFEKSLATAEIREMFSRVTVDAFPTFDYVPQDLDASALSGSLLNSDIFATEAFRHTPDRIRIYQDISDGKVLTPTIAETSQDLIHMALADTHIKVIPADVGSDDEVGREYIDVYQKYIPDYRLPFAEHLKRTRLAMREVGRITRMRENVAIANLANGIKEFDLQNNKPNNIRLTFLWGIFHTRLFDKIQNIVGQFNNLSLSHPNYDHWSQAERTFYLGEDENLMYQNSGASDSLLASAQMSIFIGSYKYKDIEAKFQAGSTNDWNLFLNDIVLQFTPIDCEDFWNKHRELHVSMGLDQSKRLPDEQMVRLIDDALLSKGISL